MSDTVKKPIKESGSAKTKQVDPEKIKLGYEEDLHKIKIALVFLFAINCVHIFAFVYQALYPMNAPPLEELVVVLYILVVFDILCIIPYFVLYYKYKKL
ncbi:MAG: hypothetical protein ACTSRG_18810 [Candidatus Helarchaeota archaeon]